MRTLLGLLILAGATSLPGGESPFEELLRLAPLIAPQPDGVLYLNAEAAARIKWTGKQMHLVNDGGGALRIEDGRITRWSGENERPCWRFRVLEAGRYRVVINRAAPSGRDCSATLYIRGPKEHRVGGRIESSGGWEALKPCVLGETDLEAGEFSLEFRPTAWHSPVEILHLADLRLIPVDALRKSERLIGDLAKKQGIDQEPEVAAAAGKLRELQGALAELSKLVRTKDFSRFADYKQFFEFDRAGLRLAETEREVRRIENECGDLRLSRLKTLAAEGKLKPQEQKHFEEYLKVLDALSAAETRTYPKVLFPDKSQRPPPDRETLFPVGRLDELPRQQIDVNLPAVQLALQPPPDAAQRVERFARRNGDEELARLCRLLQVAVIPGTAGLEVFEGLCAEGKHREALDAYRAYFFDKLAHPEKYGAAVENILFELTRDRGKGHLLFYPSAFALEKNLRATAVIQARNESLLGEVGAPGAVCWVPYGLTIPAGAAYARGPDSNPFWRTEAGKDAVRKLEFYRCLTVLPSDRGEYQSGGFFPALFFSYAVTGEKAHLARWCEYADDWCLNGQRDLDSFPYNIRNATELEPQQTRCMLNFLRIVLDERPELARDFDAATLARLVLKMVTDYTPYYLRARRAEMANWGIMSLCHQTHLSRFLHEFKAMEYFNRETWRLWNANFIQHRALDGENMEAWDDGHNPIDIDYAKQSVPFLRRPVGVDDAELTAFWDHVRNNERNLLVHISTTGCYWPTWEPVPNPGRNSLRNRHLRVDTVNRTYLDLVENEPGARRRIETILSGGRPANGLLPDRSSDLAPYAAMCYLRESWQPDADYLILQNFRERSQSQADCSRTSYGLSKAGRVLVETHGLVVDRKPDNRYFGGVRTGGKTTFCGQVGRNVVDARFHTSPQFDFAEARQDSPYARHRVQDRDPFGLYKLALAADDPEAIRDVTVLRQIFQVRGEGLWISCDRIENKAGTEREYTQFFALPVRLAEEGLAERVALLAAAGHQPVEENQAAGRFRTANPGFENLSLYCFAADRNSLRFANVLNAKQEHESLRKGALESIQDALKSGRNVEKVQEELSQRPVSVRFSAAGNQVFIAALYTRPAVFDTGKQYENDLRSIEPFGGEKGVVGFHAVTRTGAYVWFQSGPAAANSLRCGPVEAAAESLLVAKRPDGRTGGVVCGCVSLSIGGKPAANVEADFEFTLAADGQSPAATIPIRRPIDTIRIRPDRNVFTENIQVSFEIPTQNVDNLEFRYTLDGSDPTLQSALYAGPFAIERTTLVKVRAFRKGLTETPRHFTGTESSRTFAAFFRKRPLLPAQKPAAVEVGLKYAYFEGDWPALFSHAAYEGVLTPKSSGTAAALLDPAMLAQVRTTDRAYAMRYDGFLEVPKDGVYAVYAPAHLFTPTMDAGYDLRVFIDDEEWYPTPALHSEHVWHVPLATGLHRLKVSYVDYRWKTFRNEYWMPWQAEEMWQGVPVLEMSGPDLERRPIPAEWLRMAE